MDTSQYLAMFLEESMDNLQTLNDSLLELERNPGDIDKLNEIFRVAHSLKGMSATMGFSRMSELTHKMEDVLTEFREGKLEVTQEVVTVLFKCLDTLEQMVDDISGQGSEEVEISSIIADLIKIAKEDDIKEDFVEEKENKEIEETSIHEEIVEEYSNDESSVELNQYDLSVLNQGIKRGFHAFELKITIEETTLLKSARAFLIIQNVEENGELVKADPSTEELENENFDLEFSLVVLTKKDKEYIKKLISEISEVKAVDIVNLKSSIEKVSVQEVHVKSIEEEVKLVQKVKPVEKNKSVEKVKPKNSSVKDTAEQQKNDNKPAKKMHQSVRVDLERLDNFMNMVSELVIHRTRLEQISTQHKLNDLNETLEQVGRTTSELQDLVMKIRMLPLEMVFNRFPRMMRDLAVELGKDFVFEIEGQDTELDRTVIDEIGEPLIHLIRNAADHGIESQEDRIASGKKPQGKIKLMAYQEGTKAVIKVVDDGAGINVEKVREKAERVGISTEGMSDNDIKNLIFEQGFSTNEQVTDISGRGVGMDVVKTKIASLGGVVDVISEDGVGSQFIIRLPLTLQIIQALLIKVGEETLAISLGYINEIIEYNEDDIKMTNGKEVILYRERIIPVVRLNERLEINNSEVEKHFVVIANVGEKTVGLVADGLLGQQEIVIKPLGKTLKELNEYIGATMLGDGFVTLILDVAALV